MNYHRATIITLISISIVGICAIPFGDPRLIYGSVVLELLFIVLTFFVWKESTRALYACLIVGCIVIIGNSLAPPHVHLMTTFEKPINAIILIVGGYVLQGMLVIFSLKTILERRSIPVSNISR
ncbi:MAG TPA: hypothetical protein VH500_19435 [Nitrososphaeraceae archaeon]|jgi:hypothetical protein